MGAKKNTRDKIIEAAYTCFSKKGFLGTTTKEIARVAGVSEMTLFRHFGNKEKLLEEVLTTYSVLPELRKLAENLDTIELYEVLKRFGKQSYMALKKKKEFIKITLSEINMYPDRIRDIYKGFFEEMENIMIGVLKKQGDVIDPSIDIKLAVAGFRGIIFSYFKENEIILNKTLSEYDIENTIDNFVQIFLHGIIK